MFLLASCGGNDDDYYDDPYYNEDPYSNNYGGYYNSSYFHIKDLENYEYRVGNIRYDCGTLEGVTNRSGLFEYEDGANCIFSFEYQGITYSLGHLDTDTIGTIYLYDLDNVNNNDTLDALIDAMETESLEITRY